MFQDKECLYHIEDAIDHITIAKHMFFGREHKPTIWMKIAKFGLT